MSGDIEPRAQAQTIADYLAAQRTALTGIIMAAEMLGTLPEVAASEQDVMAPIRAELSTIGALVGAALGPKMMTVESGPEESTAEAVEPVALTTEAAEAERPTVTISLDSDHEAFVNGRRVGMSGSQAPILRTLMQVEGDFLRPKDIRILSNAINNKEITTSKDAYLSAGRLARKINRSLGMELIVEIVDHSGVDDIVRFGISTEFNVQDTSSVSPESEQSTVNPNRPFVNEAGQIEGSLYDGIVETQNVLRSQPTGESGILEIFSDNVLYIKGAHGTAIHVIGQKRYLINALLTRTDFATLPELYTTGNEQHALTTNEQHQRIILRELRESLGRSYGQEVIERQGSRHYKLGNVEIQDHRIPTAATPTTPTPHKMPTPTEPSLRKETAPVMPASTVATYERITARANEVDTEAQRRAAYVSAVAESTGVNEEDIRDILLIERASEVFKFDDEVGSLPEVTTLAQHRDAVLLHTSEILQGVTSEASAREVLQHGSHPITDEEIAILSLFTGLPPSTPFLRAFKDPRPSSGNDSYEKIYGWTQSPVRGNSVAHLSILFQKPASEIKRIIREADKKVAEYIDTRTEK